MASRVRRLLLCVAVCGQLLSLATAPARAAEGDPDVYLTVEAFLDSQFDQVPTSQMLWLDDAARAEARAVSGEDPGFRRRFWQDGPRTAWVLDVIGRDHPITVGITVEQDRITDVRVLVYRESRGWEVRHDFFTRQFDGAQLAQSRLDRRIDGITGATLSVDAMRRAARLALWLHARAKPG